MDVERLTKVIANIMLKYYNLAEVNVSNMGS